MPTPPSPLPPRPSGAAFTKGYWTPEKRRQLRVLTVAFPFMIASGMVCYQRFFGDEVQREHEEQRKRLLLSDGTGAIIAPTTADSTQQRPKPVT